MARLGVSISNYGGKMRMEGRDQKISVDPDQDNQGNVEFVNAVYETEYFPLPLFFRVGLSGEIIKTESLTLAYGVDALHPNDNTESINTGTEISFKDFLFIRSGYANLYQRDRISGLSAGCGIKLKISSLTYFIDYTYVDMGPLGNPKKLTLSTSF